MRQLKITKSITNRDTASLDKYLQEIAKVDLISAEEEVKLAVKIREGDEDALHKLTNANLRFVVSVAKQYQNQGLSLPDLINEGNLGLIKAAKRFDEKGDSNSSLMQSGGYVSQSSPLLPTNREWSGCHSIRSAPSAK